MKKRSFVLVAILGLGLGVSSCNNPGDVTKQQLYNNATLVDSEAFNFFKGVHEKGTNAIEMANYSNSQGATGEIKAYNDKVLEVMPAILTEMETLAADFQVVLPDPGLIRFEAPVEGDSTQVFGQDTYKRVYTEDAAFIYDQFKRLSRNTVKEVRAFGQEKLPIAEELYKLSGGTIDQVGH